MGQYVSKHQPHVEITVPDDQIDNWRDDCELMCFMSNYPVNIDRAFGVCTVTVPNEITGKGFITGQHADLREAIRIMMRQCGHNV